MDTEPTLDERTILQDELGVSRETLQRLQIYADLLVKWQASINLVSGATLSQLWTRHIIDSVQLANLLSDRSDIKVMDVGSGGGFPGLVTGIVTGHPLTLVEAVAKKCAFLRAVSSATGLATTVKAQRLEKMVSESADVITARAFAPLSRLIAWSDHHRSEKGEYLLLKGSEWQDEVTTAQSDGWQFDYSATPSITDPEGVILSIKEVRRG